MNVWVLYDRERISINRRFAEFLLAALESKNISAHLVVADNLSELPNDSIPDVVINRTVNLQMTEALESAGVSVWNNSHVSRICNDKWKTYRFLAEQGISSLPSCLINQENIESVSADLFPAVLKSREGHGGTEVFRVETRTELKDTFHYLRKKTLILQKFASEPGKDLRVYVLGKEIYSGFLRESKTDFRSNFCLGGSASLCSPLPAEVISQVKKITDLFSFGLAGIDFIFDGGKPVFNEIEDVVGTRMIYSMTNDNIAEKYIDFILGEMKKERKPS